MLEVVKVVAVIGNHATRNSIVLSTTEYVRDKKKKNLHEGKEEERYYNDRKTEGHFHIVVDGKISTEQKRKKRRETLQDKRAAKQKWRNKNRLKQRNKRARCCGWRNGGVQSCQGRNHDRAPTERTGTDSSEISVLEHVYRIIVGAAEPHEHCRDPSSNVVDPAGILRCNNVLTYTTRYVRAACAHMHQRAYIHTHTNANVTYV